MKTIGWIVGDQLERNTWFHRPHLSGGSGLVRYQWVRRYVNTHPELGVHYTLYRPWKRLDGVIFQKSMGPKSLKVLREAQSRGKLAIFDANVNYYERWGSEYYEGMLPTPEQTSDARAMTSEADAVIADSSYISGICRRYNERVHWIPDSVRMDLVPPASAGRAGSGPLRLLWSGQALKLFELLVIGDVLKELGKHIELVLVTNSLDAAGRWDREIRRRFEQLLDSVPHRIVEYRSIEHLWNVYAEGGVFISPRFLDNSYNMGHTEWKIALAMACGRLCLCSPVPSYRDLAERSAGGGIRLCTESGDWLTHLEAVMKGSIDLDMEGAAARQTIAAHYSTEKIARAHAEHVSSLLGG